MMVGLGSDCGGFFFAAQYTVIYIYYCSLMDTRETNKYCTSIRVRDMVDWTDSKNQEGVWDQWEPMGTM